MMRAEIQRKDNMIQEPERPTGVQRSFKRTFVLFFTLFLVSALLTLAIEGVSEYRKRHADARRIVGAEVQVMMQHMLRVIESTDTGLLRVLDSIGEADWERIDSSRDLWLIMHDTVARLGFVSALWVLDDEGVLHGCTCDFPENSSSFFGANDYFLALRGTASELYIGAPGSVELFGKQYFTVSRRISDGRGHFRGVVTAAIDPGYLDSFHSGLNLGRNGALGIIRTDGIVLARYPHLEGIIGKRVPQLEIVHAIRRGEDSGSFITETSMDGGARIVGFHRVGDLPLAVVGTYALRDIMDEMLEDYPLKLLPLGIVLAALAGILFYFLNRLRREEAERLRYEAALRDNEQKLRAIVDNTYDWEDWIEPGGRLFWVNPAVHIHTGYTREECMEMPDYPIPMIVDSFQDPLRKLMTLARAERSSGAGYQFRFRRKDGGTGWMSLSWTAVFDDDDTFLGTRHSYRDITARREVEEAIHESEKQLRTLVDNASALIFMKDTNFRYTMMNRQYEERFQITRERAIGKDAFFVMHRDFAEKVLEFDREVMRTRRPMQRELVAIQSDGAHTFLCTKVPLVDENGDVYAICGVATDITEHKELEALREHVERITRHDLKTPLMGVIWGARTLHAADNLDSEQQKIVERIEAAGNTMLSMINKSLDLYKMEQGTYAVQASPVDIRELVDRIVSESSGEETPEVTVNFSGRPMSAKDYFYVLGEESLLYTMLGNLLLNAFEAAGKRGVVTVNLHSGDSNIIEIHNPGAVPPEVRATFFEKYSTAGKAFGTGLGTYSARLVARTHGGDITMQTSDTEGTTVTVTLPQRPGRPR